MRDPNRLESFYEEVKRMHKEYFPDWRYGQLVYNFMSWLANKKKIDIFFPEEKELIELFKEFSGEKIN